MPVHQSLAASLGNSIGQQVSVTNPSPCSFETAPYCQDDLRDCLPLSRPGSPLTLLRAVDEFLELEELTLDSISLCGVQVSCELLVVIRTSASSPGNVRV